MKNKVLCSRFLSSLLVINLILTTPMGVMAEEADPGSELGNEIQEEYNDVSGNDISGNDLTIQLPQTETAKAAETVNPSGTTGSVDWVLDLNNGVLTLTAQDGGNGATTSYKKADSSPWSSYKDQITKVVIEEGVTILGDCLFYCQKGSALQEVIFPESSLTSIGAGAFRGNTSLKAITLPDSLERLGRVAFYDCTALESIVFGGENSHLTTLYVFRRFISRMDSRRSVPNPSAIPVLWRRSLSPELSKA